MASDTTQPVPMVDLSPFTTHANLECRQKTASELAQKISINGCVGIKGHGISSERLAEAFAMSKKLFDLPYEDKMKAPHPDAVTPHRGYSSLGREHTAAKSVYGTDDEAQKAIYANMTDFKESYEIGSAENKVDYNIWLPEEVLPGFKKLNLDLYWQLEELARCILDALVMSLNLTDEEAATVKAYHSGHEDQLRLLHYPVVPAESMSNKNFSRLGAHTDFSLFTLLFQDENGGLEFQDRKSKDSFISATPIDGVLYMNIGDMFERISNGVYPSALHRVVIQTNDDPRARKPRYSIPYFVAPRLHAVISAPSSLVKSHGNSKYEPITFEQYARQMYQTISKY